MKEENRQHLLEIADALDNAERMGAERDVPEGACYIQISHTLAMLMSGLLRQIAREEGS